ncbi:MAG TPA: O-antigen ligase family protein [Solirubrobacteraceae bacterium]|jgi:O-antigen ligase|nr:O-antigen ligase family protein [Solirubrobacteraceae bacterium]
MLRRTSAALRPGGRIPCLRATIRAPLGRPGVITGLAALVAAVLGAATAYKPIVGVGGLLAILYVPLLLLDLQAALAAWVVLLFLSGLPGLGGAPSAVALLVLLAWLAAVRPNRADIRAMAVGHRAILVSIVLFLGWVALSMTWATSPSDAMQDVKNWLIAGATFVVVATSVRSPRGTALLAGGFIAGAFAAVLAGLALTGLHPAVSAINSAADVRLSTGATDPNYLAATLVAALAMSGGLALWRREAWVRLLLACAAPVLLYGLIATQSRGGLIAAATAILVATVLLPTQRRKILAALIPIIALMALFFTVNPEAYNRLSQQDSGGDGRTELWRIAWRIAEDHPLIGVGVNNFVAREQAYVLRVGSLEHAQQLVIDDPKVVHNMYLQMLAETGIIGLTLFVTMIVALLRATYRAAQELERVGATDAATFARSVLVAQLAMLTASAFLSNGPDRRYWVLFALGPALWAIARSSALNRSPG